MPRLDNAPFSGIINSDLFCLAGTSGWHKLFLAILIQSLALGKKIK